MAGPDPEDYWLQRMAQAIEDAMDASGERSRRAYMDLACHYWSMHIMVRGRLEPMPAFPIGLEAASNNPQPLRCAA